MSRRHLIRMPMLLAAMGLVAVVAAAVPADAWWSCPANHTLQTQPNTSPNRVRCFRAASTQTANALCPPGTTRRTNEAAQDRCYPPLPGGGFGAYGPAVCPAGFTPNPPQANAVDTCSKTIPASEVPPNVNVS